MENPFKNEQASRKQPNACTIIIFGATGDLTHRKLVPGLYNLAVSNELPSQFNVIGFARRDKTDDVFRKDLEEANKKHSRQGHDPKIWEEFSSNITYHKSEFLDYDGYLELKKKLDEDDKKYGNTTNRLFYLASSPDFFDDILLLLKKSGLNESPSPEKNWSRVVCEKPFGTDLATAQHLNSVVSNTFEEKDTYRIDHYLGKETAQNIMVLRFANTIFEHLWNSKHIDHIQITCAENLGMEGGRGGYYDQSGATRDMVQNHLFQLLSLIAMEPPCDLSADAVRDEKVKVIKSLRKWNTIEDIIQNSVRAQYKKGSVNGTDKVGYTEEDRVDENSTTETYVALRLFIDTWRWDGVPFYIRMGKQLPKKATEISIHFKDAPNHLFDTKKLSHNENVLVIRIQPNEGTSIRMLSKMPGTTLKIEPVKMDFQYSESFGKASPEAYERLLLDAMIGDATLFARRDEVEHAWRFIDELEDAWHKCKTPPPMHSYPAGTWGPEEADSMIKNDNRNWRRL